MRPGLVIGTALLLVSCSSADRTPASAGKDELGQMNRDFAAALNAGDGARAASYYAEDAVIIPPGESVVKGRAAIAEYWKGAIEAGVRDASVETVDARSSGDLGYEIGNYTLTVDGPGGEPVTEHGRYIELLRREADGRWASMAGIWNPAPEDTGSAALAGFATRYAAVWSGGDPEALASFYAEAGSLSVNGGAPSVGHAAIAATARSYMTAFPDMVVKMDSVGQADGHPTFHWTWTGTNTGPGGTGRPVRISGYEEWTLGGDGLIVASRGHYDEAEYERQVGGAGD